MDSMERRKTLASSSFLSSTSSSALPSSSSLSSSSFRRKAGMNRRDLRARTKSRVGCLMDPNSKKSYLASIESLTDPDGERMTVMMILSTVNVNELSDDLQEVVEVDETEGSNLRSSPGVKQLSHNWESKTSLLPSSRASPSAKKGLKLDLSSSRINSVASRSSSFCCHESPSSSSSSSPLSPSAAAFLIPDPCSRRTRGSRRNSTVSHRLSGMTSGQNTNNNMNDHRLNERNYRTPSFRLISRSSSSASSSAQSTSSSSADSGIMSSSLSLMSSNASCNDDSRLLCRLLNKSGLGERNQEDFEDEYEQQEVVRRRHHLQRNAFFTRDSLLDIDFDDEEEEEGYDEGVTIDSSPTPSSLLLDMFLSSSSSSLSSTSTSSSSTLAANNNCSSPVSCHSPKSSTPLTKSIPANKENKSVHSGISSPVVTDEVPGGDDSSSSTPKYVERVIMELVDTEKSYIQDLEEILEGYLKHLTEVCPSSKLPCDSISKLFGNLEDVYNFSRSFLSQLESCIKNPASIAKTFIREFEEKDIGFDVYTHYCAVQFPITLKMLSNLMNDPDASEILKERQITLGHSLPLGSYLLKPVQRILKYPLLLQSIVKHSDPEEEGYSEVVEAVNTMINYASHINDIKRQKDHQNENNDGRRNSEQLKVWIWLPLSSRSKQSFSKVLSRKSVMKTLSQASKSSWIKFNRFCKRGKHEKGMKSLPETKEPFDGSKTLPASLSSVK